MSVITGIHHLGMEEVVDVIPATSTMVGKITITIVGTREATVSKILDMVKTRFPFFNLLTSLTFKKKIATVFSRHYSIVERT